MGAKSDSIAQQDLLLFSIPPSSLIIYREGQWKSKEFELAFIRYKVISSYLLTIVFEQNFYQLECWMLKNLEKILFIFWKNVQKSNNYFFFFGFEKFQRKTWHHKISWKFRLKMVGMTHLKNIHCQF